MKREQNLRTRKINQLNTKQGIQNRRGGKRITTPRYIFMFSQSQGLRGASAPPQFYMGLSLVSNNLHITHLSFISFFSKLKKG